MSRRLGLVVGALVADQLASQVTHEYLDDEYRPSKRKLKRNVRPMDITQALAIAKAGIGKGK